MTPIALNLNKDMVKQIRKVIAIFILAAFISTSVKSPAYAQLAVDPIPFMPKPGVMVHLSPEYTPAYLKGIVIHPENALKFDFIIYKGDKLLTDEQKKVEYTKLTKYFLASLAIPDDDQWVNLSPYEKDRIIKDDFGKTEMGRDLLAQDYMLKQITASLIYPEENLGKKFWDKVYAEAQQQYGTTDIPVNTFNKVWILPDDALVYEKGNTAYVLKNHLKVMMEEDYLALGKHTGIQSAPMDNKTHSIASKIIKQIVLPELEREVNEDKNFATVRQVFSGVVLAAWYKRALKESLLGRIYMNKSRLRGVDQDPKTNEEIYRRYLRAYKKGVFNFIKEDVDKYTNEVIPRKYFSGGMLVMPAEQKALLITKTLTETQESDLAQIAPNMDAVTVVDEESKVADKMLFTEPSKADKENVARLFSRISLGRLIHFGEASYNQNNSDPVLTITPSLKYSAIAVYHHNQSLFKALMPLLSVTIIHETRKYGNVTKQGKIILKVNQRIPVSSKSTESREVATFEDAQNALLEALQNRGNNQEEEKNSELNSSINDFLKSLGLRLQETDFRPLYPAKYQFYAPTGNVETYNIISPKEFRWVNSGGNYVIYRITPIKTKEDVREELRELIDKVVMVPKEWKLTNKAMTSVGEWEISDKRPLSKILESIAAQSPETFQSLQADIAEIMRIVAKPDGNHIPKAVLWKVYSDYNFSLSALKGEDSSDLRNLAPYRLGYAGIYLRVKGYTNAKLIAEIIQAGVENAKNDSIKVNAFVDYINGFNAAMTRAEKREILGKLKDAPSLPQGFSVVFNPSTYETEISGPDGIIYSGEVMKHARLRVRSILKEGIGILVKQLELVKGKDAELKDRINKLATILSNIPQNISVSKHPEARNTYLYFIPHTDITVKAVYFVNKIDFVISWPGSTNDTKGHIKIKPSWRDIVEEVFNQYLVSNSQELLNVDSTMSKNFVTSNQDSVRGTPRSRTSKAKIATSSSTDQAMLKYGGIDFNSANLNLQIKRDGHGVPLPINQQDLQNINIDGLIPIIIAIKPASSLPIFTQLQNTGNPG